MFVGIPVSKELVRELRERFGKLDADLVLVSEENLHFTLQFLGKIIEDSFVPEIVTKLGEIAKQYSPFLLSLEKVGSFPSEEHIDVIWVGMKDARLAQLMKAVREKLQYVRKNEHSEVPHLTIARLKSARNKEVVVNVMKEFAEKKFGTMTIDRFFLYESELTPQGSKYSVLKEFLLQ